MTNFILTYLDPSKVIAGVVTAFIIWLARYLFSSPRVVWGIGHKFTFHVHKNMQTPLLLDTISIHILNMSRGIANNVEIHFTSEPENFHIFPSMNYKTETNSDGYFFIKLENLGKGERLSVEMIGGHGTLPIVTRVRTDEGERPIVNLTIIRMLPMSIIRLLMLLWAFGIYGILDLLIAAIRAVSTV